MQFKGRQIKLAVMGPGLLGGSLALAWAERYGTDSLLLWGRSEASLELASSVLSSSSLTTELRRVVDFADLVVLATPVGVMADLTQSLLDAGLRSGALLTDVGSVKSSVHREIEPLLEGSGVHFVGSHPMAGSELTGFGAASANLFEGAACVLTGAGQEIELVRQLWQSLGCRVHQMTASEHDAAVAKVSHVPHLLACLGIFNALSETASLGELAGGGLRDTTRVASGSPDLWSEIILENREAVMEPLRALNDQISELLAILEASDHEALRLWLERAKTLRDSLNHYRSTESS